MRSLITSKFPIDAEVLTELIRLIFILLLQATNKER